jgi:DNA repair exonuclease SbcCD ATPase subunit
MCLTSSASAMDMRDTGWNKYLGQNSLKQNVGWDQKNLDTQARSTGNLIARLKKLEAQNEQLRNSISLIRDGKTSYGAPVPDPRILGLIDENKRLSAQIEKNRIQESSASFYAQQINTLKTENQKLSRQVEELNVKADAGIGAGHGIMEDTTILKAYMEENQLLKEALNQRDNGSDRIVVLQQQVKDLKSKNEELKLAVSLGSDEKSNDEVGLVKKEAEIAALKKKLIEAQEENRTMSLALVETTQKVLNSGQNADKATDAYENNLKAVELLKQRLSKVQKENLELNAKLDLASNNLSNSSSKELEALHQQNESLRDTIKAQSEALHSADNAAKTAERLITENATLQNKLDRTNNSHSTDDKVVQEMMMRIKTLEKDVAHRDNYIKKMLAEKSQELTEISRSDTPNAAGHVASLREKNAALAKALDEEKEGNIAYRRKIVEYQKELEHIKELEQASASGVHRASIFERHVKALEHKQQQAENTVSELRLENQELKARLELMANNSKELDNIQPAAGQDPDKSTISQDTGNEGYKKGATFLDTKYPSTERILPIFDEDNTQADYLEDGANAFIDDGIGEVLDDRLAVNHNAVDPEELLATELTPLVESVSR